MSLLRIQIWCLYEVYVTVALVYFKGHVDAAIYLINLTSQVFLGLSAPEHPHNNCFSSSRPLLCSKLSHTLQMSFQKLLPKCLIQKSHHSWLPLLCIDLQHHFGDLALQTILVTFISHTNIHP